MYAPRVYIIIIERANISDYIQTVWVRFFTTFRYEKRLDIKI